LDDARCEKTLGIVNVRFFLKGRPLDFAFKNEWIHQEYWLSSQFVPIGQDFYDDMNFELSSIKTFKPLLDLT
jgi:hypothetical protein